MQWRLLTRYGKESFVLFKTKRRKERALANGRCNEMAVATVLVAIVLHTAWAVIDFGHKRRTSFNVRGCRAPMANQLSH